MSVCITFDKMDKVGAEGVEKELSEKEFSAQAVAKFVEFLKNNNFTLEYVKELMPESAAVADVEKIITAMRIGMELIHRENKKYTPRKYREESE